MGMDKVQVWLRARDLLGGVGASMILLVMYAHSFVVITVARFLPSRPSKSGRIETVK